MAAGGAGVARSRTAVPYVLQELVDELALDTAEKQGVEITALEAWGQSLYIGTSAHEILHFFYVPSSPDPASTNYSAKSQYILASRLQPPAASAASRDDGFIKQILVLPTVQRALVLSSTGVLSFWTLPEFSPAFGGTKQLKEISSIGGLDLNEEEEQRLHHDVVGDRRGKLVMAMSRSTIKMIRIGEQARLVKELPLPNALSAARRGSIACVGTEDDYCLLDVDNMARIRLSPISTTSESDFPTTAGAQRSPTLQPSHSPDRSASPASHSQHLPRNSSLSVTPRERRHSSATGHRDQSASGHSRSTSVGNASDGAEATTRGNRGGSGNKTARSSLNPGTPASRSGSPASPPPSKPRQASVSPSAPQRGIQRKLKPHIASPTPSEFLLTTGSRPEEPGIGMFVNHEGDVTRGTISFDRYPDQLLVDSGWIIATIPGIGLEMHRWDLDDGSASSLEKWERFGRIIADGTMGIKEVLELGGVVVGDVARTLGLVPVELGEKHGEQASEPLHTSREAEERTIAQRIATVGSRIVAYQGTKIWSLLPSPLVLRLDTTLPDLADSRYDGIESRVTRIIDVLRKIERIEPDTERAFHEVSYIRQKCGLLVLGEILQMTSAMKKAIRPEQIISSENALIEGAVDPRLVVALFGSGFRSDIVEGGGGVWVYGGIKKVFTSLQENTSSDQPSTRDALLLLKRYLMAWRGKRGFGSVADEKEVFRTVDAALLRVLLLLDSPEYLRERGNTVVPEGNVRTELYSLVDSDIGFEDFDYATKILGDFGRLYVLSILYQRRKMYRDVLSTWKRILEEGDSVGEFLDGEERVKAYLLKMKDPRLVEEFGQWLASRNSRLGIQVFTDEKAKVKFEPPKVMEIIKRSAPAAVRSYIEFLVMEKKDSTYGHELIMLYLDDLIDVLKNSAEAAESLKNSYETYRALENPKPTYREFINDNLPALVSDPSSDVPWWHNRMRLLELLGGATEYNAAEVLVKVSPFREILVPEVTILYGRERRHEDALRLLTHGLKDFDTAIDYCLFGGLSLFQTNVVITDREEQKSLIAILLREFLKLKDLNERMEQTTMLLERYGGWLDVIQVLQVVPDSWSIDILSGFLISALRRLVREKAETEVARGLTTSQNLRVQSEFVAKCDAIGPAVDRDR